MKKDSAPGLTDERAVWLPVPFQRFELSIGRSHLSRPPLVHHEMHTPLAEIRHCGIRRKTISLWPGVSVKAVLRAAFILQWILIRSSDGSKRLLSQGILTICISCSLSNVLYADDLAVASFSFPDLMTALAPAFHSVDHIVAHNLNYRNSCWVQYGTGERESLRTWISEICGEFREMQIAIHAEYVGCKDNTSSDPFSRCATCNNYGYILS